MRISHKRLTIWKTTFPVLLPIYGHKCWKKSSKIGRPDWTTSVPAVAVPGYVGILGNEKADNAARSVSDNMQQPVRYQDLKTSTQHYMNHKWQETCDQQIINKLHSIHRSTAHWAAIPVRKHDVRLT
ncbi:hypothetical protein TNCV_2346171 [Trichonephila clavipes]|nr:hypothetical protein TNCV_2346171 [Trichonephila clavipes]